MTISDDSGEVVADGTAVAREESIPPMAASQGGLIADTKAWLGRHGFEIWILVGIWAVVSVGIFWLASGHESPRRYQDEFLFWAVAKNFAAGHGLTWRGADMGLYYFLYPVSLAPAFWIGQTVANSYTIVHVINSLEMVGVVFPAFFLARMYVTRGLAFLAAIFALAVPAMNYAGIIGTETLAYPVATAALGATVLAISRPRRRNWILALALIVVAMLTRAQFLVLGPIYLVSIGVAGAFAGKGSRREFFRARREPLIVMLGGAVLAALALTVIGKSVLGLYAGVLDGVTPSISQIEYWAKALSADVYIVAAGIPVIATVAMMFQKDTRRDPMIGALLAVSLVATVAMVLQITWFSATNIYDWRARHIFYERYMFYLGPLFFTGLVVAWNRVRVVPALISTAVAVLIVSGFQTDAVLVPFSYDSFGLTLVGAYMNAHPSAVPHIGMLIALVTLGLGFVYCVSTIERSVIARWAGFVSILFALTILIWGQGKTWSYARLFSHDAFVSFPKPATFIDQNTNQDVGMIIDSTDAPEFYFTTEFWNDRIVRAFTTQAAPFSSPIVYSPTCTFDWDRTGEILGTGCNLVPHAYFLRSDTVSMHLKGETKRVHPTAAFPNLTLMVGESPASILSIVDGRNVFTGLVPGGMDVHTFLDHPGSLRITLPAARGDRLVQIGNQHSVTVPSNKQYTVTSSVPAFDNNYVVTIRNSKGVPDPSIVSGMEVREPGGQWTSIL